ncbi:histidine kinase N-terminal 7TM domain-containing protein, partial [Halobium palmae]
MNDLSFLTVLMTTTVVVGVGTALLAWRERPEPGATGLAVLMASASWWAASYTFELTATSLGAKLFWVRMEWFGAAVMPVAWLVFALSYTGWDRYTSPARLGLLSVLPAATVILVWTNGAHDLMITDATLAAGSSMLVLSRGAWHWIIIGYSYLAFVVGSSLFLHLLFREPRPFRGQSVAILVAAVAPIVGNALFTLNVLPLGGLDPTPFLFTVSGVASLGALTRFRLLDTSPAPNRRARRLIFERMHDAAVVVDNHGNVVDANENAADVLRLPVEEALGQSATEVVVGYDEDWALEGGTTHLEVTNDGRDRRFDVAVTRVDDYRGRTIGCVVTFHDVSEHLRHQQRLEVLNRVLRHNIRNETNVIYGYADLLADADGAGRDYSGIVKERAMTIAEMGEKARQIFEVFEQGRRDPHPVPLAELLRESAAEVRGRFPDVTVDIGPVPEGVFVNAVVEPAVANLVENAAEHNTASDPRAEIRAEPSGDPGGSVRIVVADNGPGIGVYEQSVLERGTETPLEHGSGLGLWLVTWAVGIAGGSVVFEKNEPTGSVVTVEVPTVSPDEGPETADDRDDAVLLDPVDAAGESGTVPEAILRPV